MAAAGSGYSAGSGNSAGTSRFSSLLAAVVISTNSASFSLAYNVMQALVRLGYLWLIYRLYQALP